MSILIVWPNLLIKRGNAVSSVMESDARAAEIITLFQCIAPTYDHQAITTHLMAKFKDRDPGALHVMMTEFLKFMFLRSQYGGGFIPVCGDVDDIWHEFILQTREYAAFCEALPGQHFIHHNSRHLSDFTDGKDRREVIEKLLSWLPRYYQHFGDFTAETLSCWVMVQFLQDVMKMDLPAINRMAKEAAAALEPA